VNRVFFQRFYSSSHVEYLFTRYALNLLNNYQDKLLFIKELGRPRPDLPNLQTVAGRSKWCFNASWDNARICKWLTGSNVRNQLYSWQRILFNQLSENSVWCKVKSMESLKIKEHINPSVQVSVTRQIKCNNSIRWCEKNSDWVS
jgi:hypothetical protein